jgi:hypothetical protein
MKWRLDKMKTKKMSIMNKIFEHYKIGHIVVFKFPALKYLKRFMLFTVFADNDPAKEISIRLFFYKKAIEFEFQCLWVDVYFQIGYTK